MLEALGVNKDILPLNVGRAGSSRKAQGMNTETEGRFIQLYCRIYEDLKSSE